MVMRTVDKDTRKRKSTFELYGVPFFSIRNAGFGAEFGFSVLDPALAMASVMPDDAAQQQTEQRARQNMDSIFSGGSGEEPSEKNEDYAGLARAMMQEFVKSPMRQNLVASVPQIRAVFISRMRQLIDLDRQYGENAEIGRAQGGDPLQPPNEIEQFLNQLEAQYPTPRA